MNIPAFPATELDPGGWVGMSLRDYFAGQAIIGYMSNARTMDKAIDDWKENGGMRPHCIADFFAGLAYEVADKMIEARKPKKHKAKNTRK